MEQLPHWQAHIWLTILEEPCEQRVLEPCSSLLELEEQQRRDRLRRPGDRDAFVASHALLRVTLSRYAGGAPGAWRFGRGPEGKPEVVAPRVEPPLRFSLSHTRGLAAVMIARDVEVGVDVEEVGAGAGIVGAAEAFAAPDELAAVNALPAPARQRRLFVFWTLKEAYLKGCGRGLSLSPLAAVFRVEPPHGARVTLGAEAGEAGDEWQFFVSEPTPRHALAAAMRRGGRCDLEVVQRRLTIEDLAAMAGR